ncbi:hypothetical protein BDR04DRAFT_1106116 [Suillus decipiens]|nr:hypothetical protein BDR04DRAFT_1106116 [Suillus decipiens]
MQLHTRTLTLIAATSELWFCFYIGVVLLFPLTHELLDSPHEENIDLELAFDWEMLSLMYTYIYD